MIDPTEHDRAAEDLAAFLDRRIPADALVVDRDGIVAISWIDWRSPDGCAIAWALASHDGSRAVASLLTEFPADGDALLETVRKGSGEDDDVSYPTPQGVGLSG